MTKQEYAGWVDKLMSVQRIDTARTTNLPVMDAADAFSLWGDQLRDEGTQAQHSQLPPLREGTKTLCVTCVYVY